MVYDFAGRAKEAHLKDGEVLHYNPVQVQAVSPVSRSLISDALPQLALTEGNPTATYTDANGNVMRVALDQQGQMTSTSDGVGEDSRRIRGESNLVRGAIDGNSNKILFDYDDVGNVTEIRQGVREQLHFPTRIIESEIPTGTWADVNGDGTLDVIGYGYGYGFFGIRTQLGRPDGTIADPVDTEIPPLPGSVALGGQNFAVHDLNGDAMQDVTIVVAHSGLGHVVYTYLGQQDGTLLLRDETEVFASSVSAFSSEGLFDVFDATGDGNPDVVSAQVTFDVVNGTQVRGVEIRVLALDETGGFVNQFTTELDVDLGATSRIHSLVADLNGDNRMDVVFDTPSSSIAVVLLQSPEGLFEAERLIPLGLRDDFNHPVELRGFASGEVNGDGKEDLIVVARDEMNLLLGNGDGTFQLAIPLDLTLGNPRYLLSAELYDLNDDQNLDLIASLGPSAGVGSEYEILFGTVPVHSADRDYSKSAHTRMSFSCSIPILTEGPN